MIVELITLTEDLLQQCFELKVASGQTQYIASNSDSWVAAKENEKVARPFAIYCDGEMVGFTMFAFDEDYEDPDDRYWLWRFMIDEKQQGKGCGTAALRVIIQYFKEHGANNIRLSTKETNIKALSLYHKAGFYDTGEMNDAEIVLQLDLRISVVERIMIELSKISRIYDIRRLDDSDVDSILKFCQKNTQFYECCEAEPTREQVLNDLHIAPPGVGMADKYYIGFYKDETLIAIMDLIDGYPEPAIAFIGFFMMNKDLQGQGTGTEIIQETAAYLKTAGKTLIRLAIDKANPQSTHFWKKNGFVVIKEVDRNGWIVLVAEKSL